MLEGCSGLGREILHCSRPKVVLNPQAQKPKLNVNVFNPYSELESCFELTINTLKPSLKASCTMLGVANFDKFTERVL